MCSISTARVGAGRANVPRDACFLLSVNAGAVVAGSAAHGASAGLSRFGAGIVRDLDGSQFWGFTCIIFSEDLEIFFFFCTTTSKEKGVDTVKEEENNLPTGSGVISPFRVRTEKGDMDPILVGNSKSLGFE